MRVPRQSPKDQPSALTEVFSPRGLSLRLNLWVLLVLGIGGDEGGGVVGDVAHLGDQVAQLAVVIDPEGYSSERTRSCRSPRPLSVWPGQAGRMAVRDGRCRWRLLRGGISTEIAVADRSMPDGQFEHPVEQQSLSQDPMSLPLVRDDGGVVRGIGHVTPHPRRRDAVERRA